MSRPSAKQEIIDAALRLAARSGVGSLTFEAIADEAGKTKGGVIYHFASKEDLVRSIIARLVDVWEADARRHLSVPFEEATREDRIVAYMLSCMESTGEDEAVGDLSVLVDVLRDERYADIWSTLRERWVGDIRTLSTDQQLALVAADGIWIDEAMRQAPYPAERRAEIVARLVEMARRG